MNVPLLRLCLLVSCGIGGLTGSCDGDGNGAADGGADGGGDTDADTDVDGDTDTDTDTDADGDVDTEIDTECAPVRISSYHTPNGGWCEFDRDLPILPAFVQQGVTMAIAEPWAGGSFGGPMGESCGECWEVHGVRGTQIIMVHDL